MLFSFKGGIHTDDRKAVTLNKPIEDIPAPATVVIPMSMHTGDPCTPLVAVGDQVKLGQLIAESTGEVSAPIHASVSGSVVAVEARPHPAGGTATAIVIENDFKNTPADFMPEERFQSLTAERTAELAKEAGIVGLGGDAYPLHIKLLEAVGRVDTLIINGTESEPYITSDHRMILEHTDELIRGAVLISKALSLECAHIALLSNNREGIARLRRISEQSSRIQLDVLRTRYPQGSEKHLIRAITGREVPPGGTAADVGVININSSTVIELCHAVELGTPLTHRVVTVSGEAVANPKNLRVPIGTQLSALLDACGGLKHPADETVLGGPMRGIGQYTLEAPVIKSTNALIAINTCDEPESVCIRCGKCAAVCPMHLVPMRIVMYAKRGDLDECEHLNASDCIRCGCCEYSCPARRPLAQLISGAVLKIESKKKGEVISDADQ